MGRGPDPHIYLKVEGRADVRIGIRDSIVHIDRESPRIGTVVRIRTTKNQTETRTSRSVDRQPMLFQSASGGGMRPRVLCLLRPQRPP